MCWQTVEQQFIPALAKASTVVQHFKPHETLKSTETNYENNWKEKSLENLEKDYWGEPTYDSHLVKTCHQLRKKQIKDFEIEDLRIMIGQNIGLKFLIPFAFDRLTANIFSEGNNYKGDLLKSVITSEKEFWTTRPDLFEELSKIIRDNLELLRDNMPELILDFENLKAVKK